MRPTGSSVAGLITSDSLRPVGAIHSPLMKNCLQSYMKSSREGHSSDGSQVQHIVAGARGAIGAAGVAGGTPAPKESAGLALTATCEPKHDEAEDQQHPTPPHVDMCSLFGSGSGIALRQPMADQQSADHC